MARMVTTCQAVSTIVQSFKKDLIQLLAGCDRTRANRLLHLKTHFHSHFHFVDSDPISFTRRREHALSAKVIDLT